MDEFIDSLLREERVNDIQLPRFISIIIPKNFDFSDLLEIR